MKSINQLFSKFLWDMSSLSSHQCGGTDRTTCRAPLSIPRSHGGTLNSLTFTIVSPQTADASVLS